MHSAGGEARKRVAIAGIAAVALTAIIVVVVVASGDDSEDEPSAAAPQRCLEAWNENQAARAYGRHNFNFHRYEGALVTFLTPSGERVDAGEGGVCAVVFPSQALDPEPFAAGQLLQEGRWVPISSLPGVELRRVADLQVLAAGAPNTTLDGHGELAAL